ncbi:hypothetical protein AB0M44_39990 [Streptosporangium subroseum]|uniref:hypothetical protein n=1 Tax=Streptosporangium subroseum TaxID=106412 RepID=UPI0034357C9F
MPNATADIAREGIANALAATDGAGPLVRAAQESFVEGGSRPCGRVRRSMAVLFV